MSYLSDELSLSCLFSYLYPLRYCIVISYSIFSLSIHFIIICSILLIFPRYFTLFKCGLKVLLHLNTIL